MTVFRPTTAAEAAEVVTWAMSESVSLEIVAGGSKRGLGRPMQADHTLDMADIAGIVDYEPSELVLTARAGTTMREIARLLADGRQMLAFEPPDWRGLLGEVGEPTLGGVIACNLAGPRRVRAGAARDHFLGFSAINGWGDVWKAGSRVVKNVTGYDLSKLQCGAYGTLSVLTEISVKVMPRPEAECSLLFSGLHDEPAIALMAAALNTPHEVSAAAHVGGTTMLRLEGPAPSVAFRAAALRTLLGDAERLAEAESRALWQRISAVSPLLAIEGRVIWRVCPTPSGAAAVVAAVRSVFGSVDAFYDWGGGLVWLGLDASEAGDDAGARVVREAVAKIGGHATLVLAAESVRAGVDVFEPVSGAMAALGARVKAGFDPCGTLNPGRMWKGQ